MGVIKNKNLHLAVGSVDAAINGVIRNRAGERAESINFVGMTQLKITAVKRVVFPAYSEYREKREEVNKKWGSKDEDTGEVLMGRNDEPEFPDEESRQAWKEEMAGLDEGEVAVDVEFTMPDDFRRKEKIPNPGGQPPYTIVESDEVPGVIVDGLYDLIKPGKDAGAKPRMPDVPAKSGASRKRGR